MSGTNFKIYNQPHIPSIVSGRVCPNGITQAGPGAPVTAVNMEISGGRGFSLSNVRIIDVDTTGQINSAGIIVPKARSYLILFDITFLEPQPRSPVIVSSLSLNLNGTANAAIVFENSFVITQLRNMFTMAMTFVIYGQSDADINDLIATILTATPNFLNPADPSFQVCLSFIAHTG